MQHFLEFSDHPAAARHPSNGGELGVVLFIIARERSDRGDSVNAICVAFATAQFTGLFRCAAHDKRVCGRGNIFLNSLTTPPLRGTPP